MNAVNTKPYHLPADSPWLITGCSSGIGREIARYVASKPNQRLIATARDPSSLSYLADDNVDILKLTLDVATPSSVDNAFKAAAAHFGADYHIYVVVNNAGYSLSGDTESATEQEMHDELETLFFGTVRVTMNAVKVTRQQEDHCGGLIFNISSLAGVCGFPGHAFYHASKFPVEGWTESVAREMHPDWNLNFCVVEPSGVKTRFATHSEINTKPHEAYAGDDMPARKLESYVNKGILAGYGIEPMKVAEALFQAASRNETVPLYLPLGATAVKLIQAKLYCYYT
ncbi:short-chain dehydrogenase/reductase-like protein SDR [Delphinella strobiligena]|nr:short-chain dehydrogenase/reductase-like protein SDR [Delphinella strobiligena]